MRLTLELPGSSERLRIRARMAAERVLAEHGVTLHRLAMCQFQRFRRLNSANSY